MKSMEIEPLAHVNGVKFGCERIQARMAFGKRYREIKKSVFSKNTMDAYDAFHVFYSENNEFEAIEIFGRIQIEVRGKTVFPGTVDNLREVFPHIIVDGEGLIDKDNAVAITLSQDNENNIDSILFGAEGYFE